MVRGPGEAVGWADGQGNRLDAPIETRKHKREWTRLLRDLDRIKPAG